MSYIRAGASPPSQPVIGSRSDPGYCSYEGWLAPAREARIHPSRNRPCVPLRKACRSIVRMLESWPPMKLTILGSGTAVPNGERNSSGYFVETKDARIMMDCGAGTLHALARYGLPWEKMTHLFVSHFHVDHIGELASLFFAFRHGRQSPRSQPLTVIGPGGLDEVFSGLEQAFGSNLFDPKFPVELRMLQPGDRLELGIDSLLSVAKTPHTDESLAVRIDNDGRSVCYTGDTGYSEDVARFFNKTSVMVSECSFRARRAGVAHVSISEVARMAAIAQAARLIVTHFYFDVSEEELKRELQRNFSGEVIIGKDGLGIEV
jgi:ribonuclease BN (tRNA processing enzyme)